MRDLASTKIKRPKGSYEPRPDFDLPLNGSNREDLIERIARRSIPEPNTGCLLWMGAMGHSNYGQIRVGYSVRHVHRVAYSLARGRIPDGLVIDHKCKQPSCVNVQHMEAVTVHENSRRTVTNLDFRGTCSKGHHIGKVGLYRMKTARGWARHCRKCHALQTAQSRARRLGLPVPQSVATPKVYGVARLKPVACPRPSVVRTRVAIAIATFWWTRGRGPTSGEIAEITGFRASQVTGAIAGLVEIGEATRIGGKRGELTLAHHDFEQFRAQAKRTA